MSEEKEPQESGQQEEIPSEPITLETDGVFDPEFNVSEIFGGLPSMLSNTLGKVMSDYIKRVTGKPKMEFKVWNFHLDDKYPGPHRVEAVKTAIEERNKRIEEFLNDGWEIYESIVSPPSVMLILNREKESEENGKQES